MGDMIKVLQIIHISDLHVCEGYNDRTQLVKDNRKLRLKMRDAIEKYNWGEWHEGTLSHDDTGERAFGRFLEVLKAEDPEWFPEGGSFPQTWLVDTGDLTTFGDAPSISATWAKIRTWCMSLGNCKMRVLFGNHDAWPGTLPIFVTSADWTQKIEAQKNMIRARKDWRHERWIEPLWLDIHDTNLRIELYALNSVCFGWWENTRAIGRLEQDALDGFASKIRDCHRASRKRCYRILATHHPVAFPFTRKDSSVAGVVNTMKLINADKVIDFLRNESGLEIKEGLSPYVHLVLSGHTHAGFPADPLPRTVKEMYQGELGTKQMQLVAGPLFLVRDRKRVRNDAGPHVKKKDRDDFANPSILPWNQQFQILRFYYEPDERDGLLMERHIIVRSPNETEYKQWREDRISVLL